MIELIDVSKSDNIYSSKIKHAIDNEKLILKFGIEKSDYSKLKRILEFRPFENTGVAPYKYYFAMSYRRNEDDENLGFISVRVEQLKRHKQFEFPLSRKYISNILWFNSLNDKSKIIDMIEG